ncbi:MAG: amidase family protein [Nitratireductor sp.]
MKRAGLVLVGKSNAPENGWSIATEPKLYGPTLNPWNEEVTPGGGHVRRVRWRGLPQCSARQQARCAGS